MFRSFEVFASFWATAAEGVDAGAVLAAFGATTVSFEAVRCVVGMKVGAGGRGLRRGVRARGSDGGEERGGRIEIRECVVEGALGRARLKGEEGGADGGAQDRVVALLQQARVQERIHENVLRFVKLRQSNVSASPRRSSSRTSSRNPFPIRNRAREKEGVCILQKGGHSSRGLLFCVRCACSRFLLPRHASECRADSIKKIHSLSTLFVDSSRSLSGCGVHVVE